jgi:PST family polysaccharide transporter
MSLVWGSVLSSLVVAVLVYALTPYHPKPAFRRDDARELLRVGLPLGGTSLVFLCILNVDYVIVGRQLGADALGFYLLAFNLSMWPSNLLSLAVRRVAIPGFAQLYDDPAGLSRSFGRAFGALAAVGLLAAVVLGLLSASIISVLYGERWAPSADALSFLAVFGLCRVLIDLSYDLMVAMGRSTRLLALQLMWFFLLIPAIVIGVHVDGIAGAGAAHVVVAGGAVLPAFLIALRHAGISLRPVLSALRRPLGATAVATTVVLVARAMTLPEVARLVLVGGLAFVAFAAVALPFRELGRWWSQRRAGSVSPS